MVVQARVDLDKSPRSAECMCGSNLLTGKGRSLSKYVRLALALTPWLLQSRRPRRLGRTSARCSVDMYGMRASDVGLPGLDTGSSDSAGGLHISDLDTTDKRKPSVLRPPCFCTRYITHLGPPMICMLSTVLGILEVERSGLIVSGAVCCTQYYSWSPSVLDGRENPQSVAEP